VEEDRGETEGKKYSLCKVPDGGRGGGMESRE
jgi:hypothetical protein